MEKKRKAKTSGTEVSTTVLDSDELWREYMAGAERRTLARKYKMTLLQVSLIIKAHEKAEEEEQEREADVQQAKREGLPFITNAESEEMEKLSGEVIRNVTKNWGHWSELTEAPLLTNINPYDALMVTMGYHVRNLQRLNKGDELDAGRIRETVRNIASCCVMAMYMTDHVDMCNG